LSKKAIQGIGVQKPRISTELVYSSRELARIKRISTDFSGCCFLYLRQPKSFIILQNSRGLEGRWRSKPKK